MIEKKQIMVTIFFGNKFKNKLKWMQDGQAKFIFENHLKFLAFSAVLPVVPISLAVLG